ncbi:MAG: hypothetical protein ACOYUZ_02705 [Patescibacteria group bacterium]
MNAREIYDRKLEIEERLKRLKTEEWMLAKLVNKIHKFFPDNPIAVIDAFCENGWTPSDLYHWLNHAPVFSRSNPNWPNVYPHIFLIEELLQKAGLSRKTAHSLAITQPWMFEMPPLTLQFAVESLVRLGYEEDVIKSIANKMPHIFYLLPDHIVDACRTASEKQLGLLWNPNLRPYQPPKPPVPRFAPPAPTIGLNKKSKKIPKIAKAAPARQGVPAPDAAGLEKTETADEVLVIAGHGKESGHGALPQKPIEKLRPLRFFNPLKAALAESEDFNAQSSADKQTHSSSDKLPPLKLFNPLKTHSVPAKPAPAESIDDIEDEEEDDYIPSAADSIAYSAEADEDGRDDDGNKLKIERIEALIRTLADAEAENPWEEFLQNNLWLKQPFSVEYQACTVLLRWIPLNAITTSANFLENGENGPRFRFWKKILLGKRWRGVLQIFPEVLERRLYTLRRIGCDITKRPSWILRPWELLDDAELRFRMNEIDAHGKIPRLKPYISIMLEPKRDDFKRRLYRCTDRQAKREMCFYDDDDESLIFDDESETVKTFTRLDLIAQIAEAKKKNE